MANGNMERIADLWSTDADFRQGVRNNPEAAIAAKGISLTSEELTALRSLDIANLSDAELEARVSKSSRC